MRSVVVTGSGGLVGSAASQHFATHGENVIGIDNDMRRYFFGPTASTQWATNWLSETFANYRHDEADIRDRGAIDRLFATHGKDIDLVVHAAAQPSHDWAAKEPFTDFDINALGTINLLEAVRRHCPDAVFILMSTNKVYGDTSNRLPYVEGEKRWQLDGSHPWSETGIPEELSIDASLHSLFGASKVAADVLTQEYGRYFGLNAGVFRAGCLTGPGHSGAPLHGFLAYLMQCTLTGTPYTVQGHKAKQVRDNLHAADVVTAIAEFAADPRPGEVYNLGGGPAINCSMLEAIDLCEEIAGRELSWEYEDESRVGDHIWWVSDTRKFEEHYPGWKRRFDLRGILEDIAYVAGHRWLVRP